MPTGAEIASLKWVADFLKTVLSAVAGDRLKPKTSAEKAKTYAFDAYEDLARLKESSAKFVLALEFLSQNSMGAMGILYHVVDNVSHHLNKLHLALSQIDPQLDIFAPDVSSVIGDAVSARGGAVRRASEILMFAQIQESMELPSLIEEAKAALAQIETAVESLRAFLASEFTFKESF